MSLPEELLLKIFGIASHNRELQYYLAPERNPPASKDMHSLSVVNHQFRRLALPFLFSVLKCKTAQALSDLLDGIRAGTVRFHEDIRTLVVGAQNSPVDMSKDVLMECFTSLLITLDGLCLLVLQNTMLEPRLLNAFNAHSSLKLVQVEQLPTDMSPGDINSMHKVEIIRQFFVGPGRSFSHKTHIEQGLRVSQVLFSSTAVIPVPGLKRMSVLYKEWDNEAVGPQWFQQILQQHPQLQVFDMLIPESNSTNNWTLLFSSIADFSPIFAVFALTNQRAKVLSLELYPDNQTSAPLNASSTEAIAVTSASNWSVRTFGVQCSDPALLPNLFAAISTSLRKLRKLILFCSKHALPDELSVPYSLLKNLADDLALTLPTLEELQLVWVGRMLSVEAELYNPAADEEPVEATNGRAVMKLLVRRLAAKLPVLHTVTLNANDIGNQPPGLQVKYVIRDKLVIEGGGIEIADSEVDAAV